MLRELSLGLIQQHTLMHSLFFFRMEIKKS
jgi:hypothetical protein